MYSNYNIYAANGVRVDPLLKLQKGCCLDSVYFGVKANSKAAAKKCFVRNCLFLPDTLIGIAAVLIDFQHEIPNSA